MSSSEADLLVLGASMLGVELVHQLRKRARGRVRMIVVDRQDRHPYIPLCHERLCGRVPASTTVVDTAAYVAADPQARFVQSEVLAFEPAEHVARLRNGDRVRGRVVVIALGSRMQAPEVPGRERLLTLKSARAWTAADDALSSRLREATDIPRVLVVGGGISGVELAGELAHLRRQRPPGWGYPEVTLVHAGDRLLPELAPRVGRRAHALLEVQGARVRVGTRLRALNEDAATFEHEGSTRTTPSFALAFWTGGLRSTSVAGALGLPTTPEGWLAVGPTLQCFPTAVPSDPEIFAGGDLVRIQGGEGEWPTMRRAIECIWQAKTLAGNVLTLLAEPAGYPNGVPPLQPHVLRTDFPYGVSLGARSLIVYGRALTDPGPLSPWFRRWLMRRYLARYRA